MSLVVTNDPFKKVLFKCKAYENDQKYVYKNCFNEVTEKKYLIVMQKVGGTKDNEIRNVINSKYAKYRANMLKVIKIIDIENINKKVNIIKHKRYGTETLYRVGEMVYPDKYDENYNIVCSNGIHYFKTIRPALFYGYMPDNYTGIWHELCDNGEVIDSSRFLKGKLIENCLYWDNGKKREEGKYKNERKTGIWKTWHQTGEIESIGKYIDGEKEGTWTYYRAKNMHEKASGQFKNDKPIGIWYCKDKLDETIYQIYWGDSYIFYPNFEIKRSNVILITSLVTVVTLFAALSRMY